MIGVDAVQGLETVGTGCSTAREAARLNRVGFRRSDLDGMMLGDRALTLLPPQSQDGEWVVEPVRHGILRQERVLVLAGEGGPGAALEQLRGAGIDADEHVQEGALCVVGGAEVLMREGSFSPEYVVAGLDLEAERAHAAGYRALRVLMDLSWARTKVPFSELILFEARVHLSLGRRSCVSVCRYDPADLTASDLTQLISIHSRWLGPLGHVTAPHPPVDRNGYEAVYV